jgi:hypothetical protein
MDKRSLISIVLIGLLGFGMVFVGCDNGSTGGSGETTAKTKLEGTWNKDDMQFIFIGNTFTTKAGGTYCNKGTFVDNGTTLGYTQTHYWSNDNNNWVARTYTGTCGYVINGNTLTLSGFTGNDAEWNGDWSRQ